MKKLLLIPTICLLCFSCTDEDQTKRGPTQSQNQPSDWSITTKVRSTIMSDSSISRKAKLVSISTSQGVVTLTGSVPTKTDKHKIDHMTRKVPGVKDVHNKITISKSKS